MKPSILSNIRSFILDKQLINSSESVCVAISGGMDSAFLLYALNQLKDSLKFNLSAIHINHHLRGEESDKDQALAEKLSANWHIPLTVEHLHGYSRESSEDDLRQARYNLFDKHRKKNPSLKIATAHHLDDQLETVLMRLAKGSSLKGLTGIPVKRDFYIRPLLFLTRVQIEESVREASLPFMEDTSNSDERFLRNKIRLQLIPGFRNIFGEDFYKNFSKSLEEIIIFNDYIRENAANRYKSLLRMDKEFFSFALVEYNRLKSVEKRLFIEYCFSLLKPLNSHLSIKLFEKLDLFIQNGQSGSRFQISHQLYFLKDRERIIITKGRE